MSLTNQQKSDTVNQFLQNMALLGLSFEHVARDLGTTEQHLDRIVHLRGISLEEPWILRNYVLDEAARRGVEPVPFTALIGDHRGYWFLDGDLIDRGTLG